VRDLPWRRSSDPYRIWVSEAMLQQTQVRAVVPYFLRFVARFPTVATLAAAPLDEVLKIWQGLGYYRRAVNLHRAARLVVERFDGRVPSDAELLRGLPGVGRYMAGAIRSFAFDLPAAVLEANTARVLCRLFAVRGNLADGRVRRRLWQLAHWLLPPRRPGLHNQALMELGALVCTPRRPRCERCPLARYCVARARRLTDQLPERPQRRKLLDVHDVAAVLRRRRRVLIVQIPVGQRWGGLWELPRTTVGPDEDARGVLMRHLRDSLGLEITLGRELITVKHGVTHHRITLSCFQTQHVRGRVRPNGYAAHRWELPERLLEYPYSSAQRRVIAAIRSDGGRGMGDAVRVTSDG
jgi:A/G-specific adenine glycosylase